MAMELLKRWGTRRRERGRQKMLEALARGRVLDIGCSRYAAKLRSKDDCQYVSVCRQDGSPAKTTPHVLGSEQTLPFSSGVFDTVLILERPSNARTTVNEARRVLAPKGRLILSMPFPPDNEPADNYRRWSQYGLYVLDTGKEA